MLDEQFWCYFHELYESIPRQGPGLPSSTAKALAFLPPLRADQTILDIGCGSGVQTLELARRSAARILATDLHTPFLEILKRNAQREGLDRITVQVADMAHLPFASASFDVVWAEGSSFIIGFANGLTQWRHLLKPEGYLVISELTWTGGAIPTEWSEFCAPDPEEDMTLTGRRRAIEAAGYRLIAEFQLPREGWWDAFYLPILERLDAFEQRHAAHPQALEVVTRSRYEIDLFKRYGDSYGYTFFVLKR